MAFYDGLIFFIVLSVGLIPAVILRIREKHINNYLLALTFLMIFLVFWSEPIQLVYLLVYLLFEWNLLLIFQWYLQKYGKNSCVFKYAVLFALLPLIFAKCSPLWGTSWFAFTGISYITFRVLQILIESYDGMISKSSFLETVNFLLFFPTLSSGPIDRSRRFAADLDEVKPRDIYFELFQLGIRKLLHGALYKFVLSAIAFSYLEQISERYEPQYLVLYAYLYGIYMFFDFAGYSLMAIGTGYIFGICVPDNFNKPFISIDIKDFWDRWHISLSHWFRDFIFSRFMVWAIRGKKFKTRLDAASAGFIVNMLIMGVWHGLTLDYIVYGLYHGILLAVTERFQKTKWYKAHKNKKTYQIASWFITLNLVMFGFLIFSGKFFETMRIALTLI